MSLGPRSPIIKARIVHPIVIVLLNVFWMVIVGYLSTREKVMRHLKKAQSADKVFKGFRAYYNFVRPHMALENHTPAQAAAIPIELGTNRWLDLIRQAARNRN
ncbi:MAG: hypothetical protein ABSA50_09795 [Candidatus Bathyarchaeia archaeon]